MFFKSSKKRYNIVFLFFNSDENVNGVYLLTFLLCYELATHTNRKPSLGAHKMQLNKNAGHIILYGLTLAALIFGLKWLQWKYLIADNAIDIYIGLIAVVFTVLGAWVAAQIIKPKTETIFVEKEVIIHQPQKFVLNESELERLNLTNREYEILKLIVKGHSNADIAEQLFLSLSTIKTHVSNLYTKMDVKNRFQAITQAKRMEIVE